MFFSPFYSIFDVSLTVFLMLHHERVHTSSDQLTDVPKAEIKLAKSNEMKINHIKKLLMKSIGHFYKYSVKYGIRKAK